MKKHHGVLWYIMVFPFIAPFYIVYYMFLFSIYTILFIIQLPFQIFRIAFYQVARLLKIPTTSEKSVSSGLEYEQYCVDYLNKHGYHNAKATKASGDHGVDVIAFKRRKKYAVQCKYYSSPVGNKAIQEVYTGMTLYDCDYGIVITNSTFTKQAKDEASKLGVKLMPMVEPQGKLFPLKNLIAFIAFALFLVYPKEVFIFFSIIVFIILTAYLIRNLYRKTKSTVSEQRDENSCDYEGISDTDIDLEIPSEHSDYSLNNNSIFPNIDAILAHTPENNEADKTFNENTPISNDQNQSTISHSNLSYDELERYMVMCNAQLEHEDEMNQYK